MLQLIAPCNETLFRQENACFREAARNLSAVRDSQVLLQSLRTLLNRPTSREQRNLGTEVTRILQQRHRQLVTSSEFARQWSEVAADLRAARKRVAHWELHLRSDAMLQFGLRAAYRAAKKAMRRSQADRSADTWHELRKRAKIYGYQLALLQPARPRLIKAMKREVDEITDLLGDDRDLALLAAVLVDAEANWKNAAATRAVVHMINARRAELQRRCREATAIVFADKANEVAERMGRWWRLASHQSS